MPQPSGHSSGPPLVLLQEGGVFLMLGTQISASLQEVSHVSEIEWNHLMLPSDAAQDNVGFVS